MSGRQVRAKKATSDEHFDIAGYWQRRYLRGDDSGEGSRGENAVRKADVVARIIRAAGRAPAPGVRSLIDWGCGDGQVLEQMVGHLSDVGVHYTGVDVSHAAIAKISEQFPHHSFVLDFPYGKSTKWLRSDMGLSFDVIFHLVNQSDFMIYMERLFTCSQKIILIHSTDHDGGRTTRHVLWRRFTPYVAETFPDWELLSRPDDPEQLGFYTYVRD